MSTANDTSHYSIQWGIKRYAADAVEHLTRLLGREPMGADFEAAKIDPYSVSVLERNLLTTAGLTRQASLICGAGGQALTNTATRIGVGNGTGTAAVGDTDLSAAAGSTNRWFHTLDATFPTLAGAVATFQATFGSADGNFAWNEFGIDIGTPAVTSGNTVNAVLYNHKTSIAQGTKTAGQSWVASATVTWS